MKILAVIPARAGSKGIPNKNIRIIGEKPLIYYSINNALQSKYITDIIVTTDSPEIEIIAEQMGVYYIHRDPSLCGDEITLDSVIYNAIPKDTDWDYIVTMQPTSPTLKAETLDSAIHYAIINNLDTLISAINSPHLSWGEYKGKKTPNYEKRLNRQFLPPNYIETGAFLISKSSVVEENNRIGKNVDIYELPYEESFDIDTFEDLRNAESALTCNKVAIYVNGNNNLGLGHIYRALELADEFYLKPDIIYDINQTDVSLFGKTTHNLIGVDGKNGLFELAKKNQYSIFINDILSTSIEYMKSLRSVLTESKIVNFEDDGEGALKADLVFNALYSKSDLPNVYTGEKYYISNKTFMFYKPIVINDEIKNIFISFGGADPQNYTDRLLKIISKQDYKGYSFTVVLGRAKKNIKELLKFNNYKNINVLYDVSNMPELMSKTDIAITSRGRTGYELAMLGVPTIAMAQNSREEKHSFVSNENGFTYIGLNPSDEIIESTLNMYISLSKKSREKFHQNLLSHKLNTGRKKVIRMINSI